MKLIDDWKSFWKMHSMQMMALAGALQVFWPEVPEEIKAELPQNLVHYISLAVLTLGMVLRVVKQESVSGPSETSPSP